MFGRLNACISTFFLLSEHYWFGEKSFFILRDFRRILAVSLLLFFSRLYPLLREALTENGIHLSGAQDLVRTGLNLPLLGSAFLPTFYLILMLSFLALYFFPNKRSPAVLSFSLLYYLVDTDFVSTYTAHGLFLVSLFVLSLAPYPSKPSGSIPAWPIRVLQLTLVAIYLGNGLGKLFFGDWLDRPELLRSVAEGVFVSWRTIFLRPYLPQEFWVLAQYISLAVELFLPWGLLFPSTRQSAMFIGIIFHLGIAFFLEGLWPFSLTMISLYAAFLPEPALKSESPRILNQT